MGVHSLITSGALSHCLDRSCLYELHLVYSYAHIIYSQVRALERYGTKQLAAELPMLTSDPSLAA